MSNTTATEEEQGNIANQSQTYSFITRGSKVEVCSEEDGYQNAWFSATVLNPPKPSRNPRPRNRTKRRKKAVVRYDHMLSDDTGEPLVETLNVTLIRPTPPEDDTRTVFEQNDVVDAFYKDVWWTGYVVGVANDMYTVAFKSPPDVLEVGRSELRLHWDWVGNSKWVRPPKEAKTNSIISPAIRVEVDANEDKPGTTWLPAVYLGENGHDFHMVKHKSSDNDGEDSFRKFKVHFDRIRPSPPKLEHKDFELLQKVDAFHCSLWTVGVITKFLVGNRYCVTFKHMNKEVEFDYSELRPHMDWIDGRWISKSKGLVFTSSCQEQFMHKCDKHDSIEIITLDESSCSLNESSSSFTRDDIEEETSYKQKTTQQEVGNMDDHATISAQKRGTLQKSLSSTIVCRGKFVEDSVLTGENEVSEPVVEDGVRKATDNETSEPVMRDVEPKAADKETSAPAMEDSTLEAGDIEICEPIMEDGALKSGDRETSGMVVEPNFDVDNTCPPTIKRDNVGTSELNQVSEIPESPVENLQAQMATDSETGEAVFVTEDCTTEMLETPATACLKLTGNANSEDDDVEDHTTETAGLKSTDSPDRVSPVSTLVSTGNQAISLHAKESNSPTDVDDSGDLPELPFVKSSPIWQFLESMEAFVKSPQNPHFRPLSKCDEKEREGLAIGHMVNYANLMVEISKLQHDDSGERIDSLAKRFSSYEELGFDVGAVQDRLREWLKMRVEAEKLEHELRGIKRAINDSIDEKTRIDDEVSEINSAITNLARKRAILADKSAEHRSKVMKLSSEAATVGSDLFRTRESSRKLLGLMIPQ